MKGRFKLWYLALTLSITANLALALAFALAKSRSYRSSGEGSPVAVAKANPVTISETEANLEASDKLRWSDIASSDFEVFAENLRRIGCSEQRLADLLVPEIQRQVRRDLVAAMLKQPKADMMFEPSPAWNAYAKDSPAFADLDKEFWDHIMLTEHRREELMHAIFGASFDDDGDEWKDWPKRLRVRVDDRYFDAPVQIAINTLRDERKRKLEELRSLDPGQRPTSDEILAAIRDLRYEHFQQLMRSQPQEQIEEYILRSSPYAEIPRQATGVDLTAQEMRQIVRIFESFDTEGAEGAESSEMDAIRALIGEERFQVFEPIANERIRKIRSSPRVEFYL